ncbi:protein-arginine deiminase family protein [Streptomyces sp. NPDC001985]|uniref:protein-arginine deiminase family protein n=1 Tax=Streptomyces sp. NPDC001985 TaxID=3154406 RepID=UPI003319F228
MGTVGPPATAAPPAPPAAGPDLRADVNRDGGVDVTGDSDTPGENTWTRQRGAVLLPNVDDDSKRCPVRTGAGKPLSDEQLARCHDAADTVLNGSADAADLARLRTVPLPGASAGATGSVTVVGKGKARLFLKRAGVWKHLPPTGRLTAAELRSGVELGIEATDVVRDAAKWDGEVLVRFRVTDGTATAKDDVRLKTAPVLTHHHRQRAQEVLVTEMGPLPENPEFRAEQLKFVKDLEREAKAAGITKPVRKFTGYGDPWAQDFVEPGYVSMTGPGGRTHAIRVLIRSAQEREAGRELFEKLRGRDVGVVQVGKGAANEEGTLNSMGNLETIPPYAHGGKEYPAGRIIMGHRPDFGSKPAKSMRTFLSSQGMQSPLLLDTAWLGVGHVDEFVQFLPAKTARGWRIGIADPAAGIALLEKARAEGHGGKKMFSVPGKFGVPAPKETIGGMLAHKKFRADNKLATERIEANLRLLKAETGITDAEVVRVPALYARWDLGPGAKAGAKLQRLGGGDLSQLHKAGGGKTPAPEGKPGGKAGGKAALTPMEQTGAYIPGAVNGVVLSDSRYLAARQWGPVIGGKDIFGTAVSAAYARAGFTTAYIDDWYTYHVNGGEVHCGTNTLRDTSQPWWKRA